jgi:hypothetical protein
MLDNRNGGVMPLSTRGGVPLPPVDRICGLGVCDVLRVEIEGCQLASLRSEIDELRLVYDEAIAAAIRGDDGELGRLSYERQVLDAIDAEAKSADTQRVVIYGPGRLVSEIVAGATRNAADILAEHVRTRSTNDAALVAARVAVAWIETLVATRAVESYSFDSAFDHVGSGDLAESVDPKRRVRRLDRRASSNGETRTRTGTPRLSARPEYSPPRAG